MVFGPPERALALLGTLVVDVGRTFYGLSTRPICLLLGNEFAFEG